MRSVKGSWSEVLDSSRLSTFFQSGGFLRRQDGDCLLWLGLRPFRRTPEHHEDPLFSICYNEFFDSQTRFLQASQEPISLSSHELAEALEFFLNSSPSEPVLKKADFRLSTFADFEKTVQILLGKIQRGEIEKAVPVVFSRSEKKPTAVDIAQWISHLLQTPPTVHAFGFWHEGIGILGATPETLFHKKNAHLSTMALAGTMPRSEIGIRLSLLKDPKEMHEHQLVVQDLERQLGKLGTVQKTLPQILELPTLLHLQSLLEVETSEHSIGRLIQLLHPTPALGVSPRAYGFHWLQSLNDQQGRRIFGAPVAFSLPSEKTGAETLCLVAIRNMQWDENGSRMGAGCGIVKESLPEREWQEVQHKLSSIQLMLGLQ